MSNELHEWVHTIGRRHGFLASGEGEAPGEDAALQRMREHNARLLAQQEERRQRAGRQAEELRARGLDVQVEENPDGSVVVLGEGERPGGPLARMREQNARLSAQLEERRRRAQAEVDELRAQGFDARLQENPDGSIVVVGQRDRLPASSRPDAEAAELVAEARELHRRATEAVDGLLTAVHRSEHVDFLNRINGFNGRINDPALQGDAQELRRVIADLRELIADAESRSREVDRDTDETVGGLADGTAGPETPGRHRPTDGLDPASTRADAELAELDREAQQLFRRAVAVVRGMQGRLPAPERREMAARLNTFNGRVTGAGEGDAQERRRVVTDLRAAIADFERRARELERSPAAPGDAAGGGGADANPRANPSAHADTDFASVEREAREVFGRATRLYEAIARRVEDAEHRDLRDRVNAFRGRIQDPANRGDAREMRRVVTDLRALLADMQARARELA